VVPCELLAPEEEVWATAAATKNNNAVVIDNNVFFIRFLSCHKFKLSHLRNVQPSSAVPLRRDFAGVCTGSVRTNQR
jgi:hypothetical protein